MYCGLLPRKKTVVKGHKTKVVQIYEIIIINYGEKENK